MKMIIGGAFQGKSEYARNEFPNVNFKKASELSEEDLYCAEGVLGFHEYIRKEMKAGKDVSLLAEQLIEKNPDVILVSDEVGYGVVPIDAFDRAYREAVGRVCTKLAAHSNFVVRVALGLGTVIKDTSMSQEK